MASRVALPYPRRGQRVAHQAPPPAALRRHFFLENRKLCTTNCKRAGRLIPQAHTLRINRPTRLRKKNPTRAKALRRNEVPCILAHVELQRLCCRAHRQNYLALGPNAQSSFSDDESKEGVT